MTAAAYLRKSVSHDPTKELSREYQEAAVRQLANGSDLTLYVDWNLSGRKADRPQYLDLKAAIRAGQVTDLYAYSLSRLGRSARELLVLFELCQAQHVRVHTTAEGTLALDSAMGRFQLAIFAAVAELEAETAVERTRAAIAARRARGDDLGSPGYGRHVVRRDGVVHIEDDPHVPIAPILEAYQRIGTVLGTVRYLNANGPATMYGGPWTVRTLGRILRRRAPELMPLPSASGRFERHGAPAYLGKLLRCQCGRTLTPQRQRGGSNADGYYCARANADPRHHRRGFISESKIIDWIQEEAALLDVVPGDTVVITEDSAGRLASLAERKRRLAMGFADNALEEEDYKAELAKLNDEIKNIEGARSIKPIEPVDWSWDKAAVNACLRAMWAWVEVDDDFMPIRAEWRVPEWRREAA